MHTYEAMRETDLERVATLLHHAFANSREEAKDWISRFGSVEARVMRPPGVDGAGPDAAVKLIPMGQYFGGRSVPMLGIAGVAVAPECRGSGLARTMMEHTLREARERALPISTLFASTQALYRQVGYEQAGHRHRIAFRPDLAPRDRAMPVRPLADADEPQIRSCYAQFASCHDGTLDRGHYCWARTRDNPDAVFEGFGVEGEAGLEGYCFIRQIRIDTGRQHIAVSDLAFMTARAGRRLLGFLADFAMVAEEVSLFGGAWHPLLALMPMQRFNVELRDYWMLRVADLPAALQARGYAGGVRTAVALDVVDKCIPENAGPWTLEVEAGSSSVVRRARPATPKISCDIRALGAMYSGFVSPTQARLLGWIEGDDSAIAAASSVFAPSTPWMADMF